MTAPPPNSRPLTGLVVDDNAAHRTALCSILMALGIEPEVATDGEMALQTLRRRRYDVVLMDFAMPNKDGITALKELRTWERASRRSPTPVLMVTSHDEPQDRLASLSAGADGHVGKPIGVRPMVEALQRVLGAA